MKKIYYLLAFAVVAIGFTACDPMNKTYKDLGPVPQTVIPGQSITVTLSAADYGLLPTTDYAKTSLSYKSKSDAAVSIPTILASKYAIYPDKSTANVTYALSPVTIKLADTLNADVAYTLTAADYRLLPNNTFTDFSTAQILSWLPYKYPTPQANQLAVLTYTYFESGATPSAGVANTTDAFLYTNGAWQKIYRVSAAQYTSVGRGVNNWFIAADASLLPSYINTFLKADPIVAASAKFGSVMYVNYRYLTTYQRVIPVTFDGTNWVTTSTPLSLTFLKTNGVWVADNTVSYTLTKADYTFIGTTSINIATARANVASFGDFNIATPLSATTGWSDSDINLVLVAILTNDFKSTAVANQKFVVTYLAYNGSTISVTKTFQYDGTTFALVP